MYTAVTATTISNNMGGSGAAQLQYGRDSDWLAMTARGRSARGSR